MDFYKLQTAFNLERNLFKRYMKIFWSIFNPEIPNILAIVDDSIRFSQCCKKVSSQTVFDEYFELLEDWRLGEVLK